MWFRKALKSSTVGLRRHAPRRGVAQRAVVLLYHSVNPDSVYSSASPEEFRQHLEWLSRTCRIVPLEEIPACAPGHEPGPTVAITFDDGHLDNYIHAFPILHELDIPATFFVTAGYMDRDPAVLSRLEMLNDGPVQPMEWRHVREMRAAGLTFGAHTCSHPNLATLARAAAYEEIRRSREILQERMGERVGMFAYPFGRAGWHFTQETVELVSESGFDLAASVGWRPVRWRDCPFSIPRYWVIHDDIQGLEDRIRGVLDFAAFQERLPLGVARRFYPDEFPP